MFLIAPQATIFASEGSPFTNVSFGWFPGRGDFIKIENYDLINSDKTHLLIEVNGVDYQDLIKDMKALYGKDAYKCRFVEHFKETMKDLGIDATDTVDLKIYRFDGSHTLFDLEDVPVTEENLDILKFDTNFCR